MFSCGVFRCFTPVAEIALRAAPLRVESSTEMSPAYELPLARPLIVTSSLGTPPMSRWLSVTRCPKTATPYIGCPGATSMSRLLIVTSIGAGLFGSERLTKKTASAAMGSPSVECRRTGPRPSETMQAPSEVIAVSSCETQSPRVA